MDDVVFDILEQHLVSLMGFPFVRHQRVLVRHRPQADPLTQGIQIGQMTLPPLVHRFQHHQSLETAHVFFAQFLLLQVVDPVRQIDQVLQQVAVVHLGPFLRPFPFGKREDLPHGVVQTFQVPEFWISAPGKSIDEPLQLVLHHPEDGGLHVFLQDATALSVDHLSLLVDHVVVLEHVLPDVEVVTFHFDLGIGYGFGNHAVLDRHVLVDPKFTHQPGDALPAESTHELVLQRDVEPGRPRITLTTGTASQLVVDPASFVPLRADDVQTAELPDLFVIPLAHFELLFEHLRPVILVLFGRISAVAEDLHRIVPLLRPYLGQVEPFLPELIPGKPFRIAAEQYVHTTTCHVGGYGHRSWPPGLGDDLGFALVVLGVQHLVRYPPPIEHVGEELGRLDRHRANQHRPFLAVELFYLLHHGLELRPLVLVDHVGVVDSLEIQLARVLGIRVRDDLDAIPLLTVLDQLAVHGPVFDVGGQNHDLQIVDLGKLLLFGLCRTGHTGELVVHAEEILERDGRQGQALLLYLDPFLGLDCLVQAFCVPPAEHEPPSEFVYDDHLAVFYDVILVPLVEDMGAQSVVQVRRQLVVFRRVEVVDAKPFFDLGDAGFSQGHDALFLLDGVILFRPQLAHQLGEFPIVLGGFVGHSRYYQRCSRLVDQDVVHLVDDRIVQLTLSDLVQVVDHVVTQVIEAKFVVRAVGYIGEIGLFPGYRAQVLVTIVRRLKVRIEHVRSIVRGTPACGLNDPHAQSQQVVDRPHPLRIALGQVIVHRDHVDASAGKGIEVNGHRGDQGLAFAGPHFHNFAPVELIPADNLNVVVAQANGSLGRFPDGCKGPGKDSLQNLVFFLQDILFFAGDFLPHLCGHHRVAFPKLQFLEFGDLLPGGAHHVGYHLLKFPGLLPKFLVGEFLELFLQTIYLFDQRFGFLQRLCVGIAGYLRQKLLYHLPLNSLQTFC